LILETNGTVSSSMIKEVQFKCSKWISILLEGPEKRKGHFSKRQKGGTSVMIWAGFSELEKADLVFVEVNQKSHKYIYTLS